MLTIGKKAPAFSLPDKDNNKISLKYVKTKYTLIYFYPKDNTPGCTLEAIGFNKLKTEFDKLGVSIIGISGGNEKSKTTFCEKYKLGITLLSDKDFTVSTKYDVYGEKKFMGQTYKGISRCSYLLDTNKKIIKTYENVKAATHHKEVIMDIKAL
ncbi:thioredoxin-dependent thiol peroxidase [Candidatus Woesearchaeota archaeon]|nr:thioredoxin-dependent thiol peroxidase [Candidatus Woesearchaeota archaeon]